MKRRVETVTGEQAMEGELKEVRDQALGAP